MAKPRGRPPKKTILTEYAHLIQDCLRGNWNTEMFAALISLARYSSVKEAAREASAQRRDGKKTAPETINVWLSMPLFVEDLQRARKEFNYTIVSDCVAVCHRDACISLYEKEERDVVLRGKGKKPDSVVRMEVDVISDKKALAHIKNRELFLKMSGKLNDGAQKPPENEVRQTMALATASDDDLIALASGEKDYEDVIAELVPPEGEGDGEETKDDSGTGTGD